MASRRVVRVNALLRREIGNALYRVMTGRDFDMSAVTVTRVITSCDLRTAEVMVSIRAKGKEGDRLFSVLRHRRGEIQKMIGKSVVLKYTPHLSFTLDTSLEEGDRVLDVLRSIETEEESIGPVEEPESERLDL